MRQVFLDKGSVVVKEVAQPLLEDTTILVSVYYSFISPGTESATISGAQSGNSLFSNIPKKITKVLESVSANGIEGTKALIRGKLKGQAQAIGYSCSGKVIAVGKKVKTIRPGDLVACAGAGFANHADVVSIPENLVVKISNEKFIQEASITTIGAIALQGIRRAQLQLGEQVCVIGLGLLGQITVQLAALSGCKVIGIDPVADRCKLAEQFGAYKTFLGNEEQLQKDIAHATEQQGTDHTIITAASSSDAIVQQAMEVTRKKGKVILVGDVGLSLERSPFYQKEIDFLISCSYGPGRYDTSYEQDGLDYPFPYVRWTENRNMKSFVELVEQKKLHIKELITDTVNIEHIEKAYSLINQKKALGVILHYLPKEHPSHEITTPTTTEQKDPVVFKPAKKGSTRIGFIGVGGFAQVKLLPLVSRIKNTSIDAVVDKNIASSLNTSRLYGAAQVLTNDKELFDQDLVDAVVIASPHKFHYEHALQALKEGKAVFLEKPMVTSNEQLTDLVSFLRNNPNAPFCVDYNRSFAPFIRRIKSAIKDRSTPLMVHYRMNAGYIPKKHWVQTELGAGRIIGEACHIFDLFAFLTDAKPMAVSVEALQPSNDELFPTDNFSAQISYTDGSVCTLLYTALGHQDLGKEYMEVYYDSKTITMHDYKAVKGYGLPKSFDCSTSSPDKGHECLLKTFFTGLHEQNYKSPISVDRLESVANLTLVIDQLAVQGGGIQELK